MLLSLSRRRHAFLVAAVVATMIAGCAPQNSQKPASSSSSSSITTPMSAVELDTEMACQRTRSAGAWTQLVYRTDTWKDLAERADHRDANAWKEIGNLIERNLQRIGSSTCTDDTLRDVRATAARLASTSSSS